MATVTLEEKRLKQLKQQLFGKADLTPYKVSAKEPKSSVNQRQTLAATTTFDSINLRSDITKIIIFSAAAIIIQFSLFLANQNGLIKLFR